MKTDVVSAEAEMSVAANNIQEYASFLSRTIQEYTNILAEIQNKAIQDDLICAKLSGIEKSLRPYKTSFADDGEELKQAVKEFIRCVEAADCFSFSSDVVFKMKSLFSLFS